MTEPRVVLCVDDDPRVRELVRLILEPQGFRIVEADTGLASIQRLRETTIDMALIDLQLPDVMGYALAVFIRNMTQYQTIPIVALTGAYSAELIPWIAAAGFDTLLQKPFSVQALRAIVHQSLDVKRSEPARAVTDPAVELRYLRRLSREMAHDLWRYVEELNRKTVLLVQQAKVIEEIIIYTIHSIIRILETNEQYTAGHSQRVGAYAVMMGRRLGLTQEELRTLELGGTFHDLGKVGVDRCILRKPHTLTDEEWAEIRRHPALSYELLVEIPFLREVAQIAGDHHERYDGKGYPCGKKGDEIAISSHCVILADAFDAMTSHRSYRRALPLRHVVAEIERCTGTQFHPEVAEVWLRELYDRGEAILEVTHRQFPIGDVETDGRPG
ncbi:MAG: response regulator [Acidobacteria bacterium]|nr:response regulator [Acidobacteriota bacterium]MDW7983187.1 HD domain-containing phosphohydrolase [Acidobacteriota bacterium]